MSLNHDDRDRDLREPFQALRRAEATQTPPFDPARRAARPHPAPTSIPARLAWSTAFLLMLGAVIVFSVRHRRPSESSIDQAIAQARELRAWSASTDALLPEEASRIENSADADNAPDEPATQPTQSPD